jgi:hypothetical protein
MLVTNGGKRVKVAVREVVLGCWVSRLGVDAHGVGQGHVHCDEQGFRDWGTDMEEIVADSSHAPPDANSCSRLVDCSPVRSIHPDNTSFDLAITL